MSVAFLAVPLGTTVATAVLALFGTGLLVLVSRQLLRCPHAHELFDRFPDGRPALRCRNCLQIRPNILGQPEPRYRLPQPATPVRHVHSFATGIERVTNELDFPITDADLFDFKTARQLTTR